jgi:hypothetical protein
MTSGTAQQQDLEQAMEHFGFGTQVESPKVYVIAEVMRLTIKTMDVVILNPADERPTRSEREFYREQVRTDYFNHDRVMIAVPQSLIDIYRLRKFELTPEQIADYTKKAKRFSPGRF